MRRMLRCTPCPRRNGSQRTRAFPIFTAVEVYSSCTCNINTIELTAEIKVPKIPVRGDKHDSPGLQKVDSTEDMNRQQEINTSAGTKYIQYTTRLSTTL